jgi:hypothetical protein
VHGELKDYRQPMVTSIGILLGFLLNFLAGWGIRSGQAIEDGTDALILGCVLAAVLLMTLALYRILNADLGDADPAPYYRTTLRIYISAIVLAFTSLPIAILL